MDAEEYLKIEEADLNNNFDVVKVSKFILAQSNLEDKENLKVYLI